MLSPLVTCQNTSVRAACHIYISFRKRIEVVITVTRYTLLPYTKHKWAVLNVSSCHVAARMSHLCRCWCRHTQYICIYIVMYTAHIRVHLCAHTLCSGKQWVQAHCVQCGNIAVILVDCHTPLLSRRMRCARQQSFCRKNAGSLIQ